MDATNVIIPSRGAVFYADIDTAAPDYKTLNPLSPDSPWKSIGHTSRDNAIALERSGGDATTQASWWDASLITSYDPVTWSLTIDMLEVGKEQLDLAFAGALETTSTNGGYTVPSTLAPIQKAVFILVVDGSKRLGLYLPRVSLTIGQAPSFAADGLFTIQLQGNVLTGYAGYPMEWFSPALDK